MTSHYPVTSLEKDCLVGIRCRSRNRKPIGIQWFVNELCLAFYCCSDIDSGKDKEFDNDKGKGKDVDNDNDKDKDKDKAGIFQHERSTLRLKMRASIHFNHTAGTLRRARRKDADRSRLAWRAT